jgi:hypothetical protein
MRFVLDIVSITLLLCPSSSCAHQEGVREDAPLYEELLLPQIDRDKPKPKPDFPFDELMLEDDVPEGEEAPAELDRPTDPDWHSYTNGEDSESVGKPNKGRLLGGRLMPADGRGWIRKNDKAPFGTDETVAMLVWVCRRMVSMYPGTVPLVIGDLSRQRGKKLRPHSSHQSGRDVDIGYYFVDNEVLRRFKNATRKTMDVEKTWTLIDLLLSTGQIEYLFIDRKLQPPLYEEAGRRGWSEEELRELFEAPLGKGYRRGIIRHQKGHRHHIHVRFHCDSGDARCR